MTPHIVTLESLSENKDEFQTTMTQLSQFRQQLYDSFEQELTP